MKKFISMMMVLALSMVMLVGCSEAEVTYASWCDDEDIETMYEKSEIVLENCEKGDYQAIVDTCADQAKETITVEWLEEQVGEFFANCGEVKTSFIGTTDTAYVDKNENVEYQVVGVSGKYENGKIKLNLAYNEDLQLVKFEVK